MLVDPNKFKAALQQNAPASKPPSPPPKSGQPSPPPGRLPPSAPIPNPSARMPAPPMPANMRPMGNGWNFDMSKFQQRAQEIQAGQAVPYMERPPARLANNPPPLNPAAPVVPTTMVPSQPHVVLPEYEHPAQKLPTPQDYGLLPELSRMIKSGYNKSRADVEAAGQGKYTPVFPTQEEREDLGKLGTGFTTLANVAHNIGQSPWGKPLTALTEAAFGDAGVFVLPARMVKQTVGEGISRVPESVVNKIDKYAALPPEINEVSRMRRQLQVDSPVKEQAFQAALSRWASGPTAMRNIYEETLPLAERGELSDTNIDVAQRRHETWWKEMIAEIVLDPTNLLMVGGKNVMQTRRLAGARAMFMEPMLGKVDDITKTARLATGSEVLNDMKQMASRANQMKDAEMFHDTLGALINPRFKETVVHRQLERSKQILNFFFGTTEKQVLSEAAVRKLGSVDTSSLLSNNFQTIAKEMVRLASDNVDEVEAAAKTLKELGYGDVPLSKMGRRTAEMVKQITATTKGEPGDISRIVKNLKAEQLTADDFVEAMMEKIGVVTRDLVEEPKWESSAIMEGVDSLTHLQAPMKRFFGNMFMGLSLGYPIRNFVDNMTKAVVNHFSPFRYTDDIAKRAGYQIVGGERDLGVAMGVSGSLPGTKLGSLGERYAGHLISQQAHSDVIRQGSAAVARDLERYIPKTADPTLSKRMQNVARMVMTQGRDRIDELERELARHLSKESIGVGENAIKVGDGPVSNFLDGWRHDDDVLKILEDLVNTGDNVSGEVAHVVANAESVQDAVEKVRKIQQQYMAHAVKVAEDSAPWNHAVGTLTGEAIQNLGTVDNIKEPALAALAEKLGGIEHNIQVSRNRAYQAITESLEPTAWTEAIKNAETEFKVVHASIRHQQTRLYTQLLNGDITAEKYGDKVFDLYHKAWTKLDGEYSRAIGEVAGPGGFPAGLASLPKQTLEEATPGLIRQELTQQAYKAGYFSLVDRAGSAKAGASRMSPLKQTDLRPAKQFSSLVEEVLGEPKTYQQLTSEDQLKIINTLRSRYGKPEFDINEAFTRVQFPQQQRYAAPKITAFPHTATIELPGGETMYLLDGPFKGKTSVEDYVKWIDTEIGKLTDTDARQALEQLKKGVLDGDISHYNPGPSIADSSSVVLSNASPMLDNMVETLERIAKIPPPPPSTTAARADEWVPFFQNLRSHHTDLHVQASEVARRARDHALLDYGDRRMMDPMIGLIYPWGYWHTRSMPNFAVSIVHNPAMAAHYMKFKNYLRRENEKDPSIPEWQKEAVAIRVPGFPGAMYWDSDALFNSMGQVFDTFEDEDKTRDVFGQGLQALSLPGPAPAPWFYAAYAAERAWLQKDEDAWRNYGYLSGATRGVAAATGKVLEPWLWQEDERGRKIPFTGGSKWDIQKATKQLAYNMGKGDVPMEEGMLGAATQKGPAFTEALLQVLESRRKSALGSVLFGLRLGTQMDWEAEVYQASSEYQQAKKQGPEATDEFFLKYPWMSAAWMSKDNEAGRIQSLARNVMERFPPGMARDEILQEAGINEYMMDAFNNPDTDITEWDYDDYEQFADGVIRLAEILGAPDAATAREWKSARREYRTVKAEIAAQYPQYEAQQQTYNQLKEQNPEEAKAMLKDPNVILTDVWSQQREAMMDSPLLRKYYVDQQDIDMAGNTLYSETIDRLYPGVRAKLDEFYSLGPKEKKLFKLENPDVVEYLQKKDTIKKNVFAGLEGLRATVGVGAKDLSTIDYIVQGKPNFSQMAILDAINTMGKETEPPNRTYIPAGKTSDYSDEDVARFQMKDQITQEVYSHNPALIQQERTYNEMAYVYGYDTANLWAQQNAPELFDAWRDVRIQSAERPELLIEMDDDELAKVAKAYVSWHSDLMWPGLDNLWAAYNAIPKSDKQERRAFWKATPQLGEYLDWKNGKPENFYMDELLKRRAELRKNNLSQGGSYE